jgi:hypothetical protein
MHNYKALSGDNKRADKILRLKIAAIKGVNEQVKNASTEIVSDEVLGTVACLASVGVGVLASR